MIIFYLRGGWWCTKVNDDSFHYFYLMKQCCCKRYYLFLNVQYPIFRVLKIHLCILILILRWLKICDKWYMVHVTKDSLITLIPTTFILYSSSPVFMTLPSVVMMMLTILLISINCPTLEAVQMDSLPLHLCHVMFTFTRWFDSVDLFELDDDSVMWRRILSEYSTRVLYVVIINIQLILLEIWFFMIPFNFQP